MIWKQKWKLDDNTHTHDVSSLFSTKEKGKGAMENNKRKKKERERERYTQHFIRSIEHLKGQKHQELA